MTTATTKYTKAEDELGGKRARCVAGMLALLAESDGPVEWSEMCDHVGMDHHGQLMPAMHALELVGAVERFSYVEDGSTRPKPAFSLSDDVEVT